MHENEELSLPFFYRSKSGAETASSLEVCKKSMIVPLSDALLSRGFSSLKHARVKVGLLSKIHHKDLVLPLRVKGKNLSPFLHAWNKGLSPSYDCVRW